MSMVFIDGRNNDYPCIEELADHPSASFVLPYPEMAWKVAGTADNGYPCLLCIPKIPRKNALLPLYPDFCMHCLGEKFNDGYPCILRLENIERSIFSDVYFGSREAKELFVGGRSVESAYCNGQKVYGSIYVTMTQL